jgi:hypothetical protein
MLRVTRALLFRLLCVQVFILLFAVCHVDGSPVCCSSSITDCSVRKLALSAGKDKRACHRTTSHQLIFSAMSFTANLRVVESIGAVRTGSIDAKRCGSEHPLKRLDNLLLCPAASRHSVLIDQA